MTDIKEPEQGLIIAGTSWLLLATQKVILANGDQKPGLPMRYSDPLAVMADHGFKAAIPAMSAYAAARMAHDGTLSQDSFPLGADTSMHYNAMADPQEFLQDVIRKRNKNIAITLPDETASSPAAHFIRAYNHALSYKDIDTRRFALKTLQSKNIKGYSDMAAEDLVKSLPYHWKKPIFYFTDDSNAYEKLKKARPDLAIGMVSTKGYLVALQTVGLNRAIGLKTDAYSVHSLANHMEKNLAALRHDETSWHTNSITDSSVVRGKPQDHFFANALSEVAGEIHASSMRKNQNAQARSLTAEEEARVAARLEAQKQQRISKFTPRSRINVTISPEGELKGRG